MDLSTKATAYLAVLRQIPFVQRATVIDLPDEHDADALLLLQTPKGPATLLIEEKTSHLAWAQMPALETSAQRARLPLIIFAPYVGDPIGRRLEDLKINYVDRTGRCCLHIGADYVAKIRPSREKAPPNTAEFRAAGYKVLFALLAVPQLIGRPLRQIAYAAGTSTMPVRALMTRLESEGIIGGDGAKRRILRPKQALDRWLAGYADVLRPSLTFGAFQTKDSDPSALEARIEAALGTNLRWGWTGGAAARRMAGHFRGRTTGVIVVHPPTDLAERIRALPAADGPLHVFTAPSDLALQGTQDHLAHPLLVYAELLADGNERAREAAEELQRAYLPSLK